MSNLFLYKTLKIWAIFTQFLSTSLKMKIYICFFTLALTALQFLGAQASQGCITFSETSVEWNQGRNIDLSYTFASYVPNYKLELTFDGPLTAFECWAADSATVNSNTHTLTQWSSKNAGDTIAYHFQAQYNTGRPSVVSVKLNGQNLDICAGEPSKMYANLAESFNLAVFISNHNHNPSSLYWSSNNCCTWSLLGREL